MIPLYNINSLKIENMPSIATNKTNTKKIIYSFLILTVLGLGLYIINKTILDSTDEEL